MRRRGFVSAITLPQATAFILAMKKETRFLQTRAAAGKISMFALNAAG